MRRVRAPAWLSPECRNAGEAGDIWRPELLAKRGRGVHRASHRGDVNPRMVGAWQYRRASPKNPRRISIV